jgi:hypothetical protein
MVFCSLLSIYRLEIKEQNFFHAGPTLTELDLVLLLSFFLFILQPKPNVTNG